MRLGWFLALFGAFAAAMFVPASPASAQIGCTFIFKPVCARTPSGALQTFSNACFADAAKATVVRAGECKTRGR